eukprot:jgi/Tetstr1/450201/TSEL_037240.t1
MPGLRQRGLLAAAEELAEDHRLQFQASTSRPIVSSVQRNKVVSLPLAGTAASSPKLHGLVMGVVAQQRKRAGGIIKHNTNAVKNLPATQAVPGDNVDEGSSPESPAKKAKQPAKPAALECRPGAGVVPGPGRAVCKQQWILIQKVGFLRAPKIGAEMDGFVNPGLSCITPPVYHIVRAHPRKLG